MAKSTSSTKYFSAVDPVSSQETSFFFPTTPTGVQLTMQLLPFPSMIVGMSTSLLMLLMLSPVPTEGFLTRAPMTLRKIQHTVPSSAPSCGPAGDCIRRQHVIARLSPCPEDEGINNEGLNSGLGAGKHDKEPPNLEHGVSPMPTGGESEYEYQSEYTDQQAEIEYLGDDELLARYRADMQNSNDQWQLNLFLKAQTGIWSGVWSEYTPEPNSGPNGETVLRMTNIYKGRHECEGDYDARSVWWREVTVLHAADGGPLEPVVVGERRMEPTSFRGELGAMAADNVFSCSHVRFKGATEVFEAEIWIRQGDYRTRVTFVYKSPDPADAFQASKVLVKKERLGKQGPTAEEPELFGSSGRGIYDPNARVPGSWVLSLHGGLSLAFPPTLPRGQRGAVIVDWTAGTMRFQADRIFDRPDGTLGSLEVTQIGTQDSLTFTIPDDVDAGVAKAAASADTNGGEK